MISPWIDSHVKSLRHMAADTLCAVRPCLMAMVLGGIEALGFMALRAECVALRNQLSGMRIVAVGAGHAFEMHFALQERTQHKHFVVDLAVGKVEPLVEQGQAVLIMVGGERVGVAINGAPRMATATGIDVGIVADTGRRGDIVFTFKRPGKRGHRPAFESGIFRAQLAGGCQCQVL